MPCSASGPAEAGQLDRSREAGLGPQPDVQLAQLAQVGGGQRAYGGGDGGEHAAGAEHPGHLGEHRGQRLDDDEAERARHHVHGTVAERQHPRVRPDERTGAALLRQPELGVGEVDPDDGASGPGELAGDGSGARREVDDDTPASAETARASQR